MFSKFFEMIFIAFGCFVMLIGAGSVFIVGIYYSFKLLALIITCLGLGHVVV